jgi:hypothetical protein
MMRLKKIASGFEMTAEEQRGADRCGHSFRIRHLSLWSLLMV